MECDPRSGFVGIVMTSPVLLTSECYVVSALVSIEKFCLSRVY